METIYRLFLEIKYNNASHLIENFYDIYKKFWTMPIGHKMATKLEKEILGKPLSSTQQKIDLCIIQNPNIVCGFYKTHKAYYSKGENNYFYSLDKADRNILLEYLIALKTDHLETMNILKQILIKDLDYTKIPDEYFNMNPKSLREIINEIKFF